MERWWIIRSLLRKVPLTIRLIGVIIIIASIIGGTIHLLEPLRYPTLFDGIWWAIVTVSTVGYGDFTPESVTGRILGMLLIFTGVGVMTLLFSSIAAIAFSINRSTQYGELAFLGENHFIIVGWNERSKYVIDQLIEQNPTASIVLIDETLQELPEEYDAIHFVKGNSSEDSALKQANIGFASSVLITAKHKGSEFSSDARTILTTLAVKCQNPKVYIVAEIMTKEQYENCLRAGADECVLSTKLTGAFFVSCLHDHQMGMMIETLLSERFLFQPASPMEIGRSFSEALSLLYRQDKLLIGIKKEKVISFHPPKRTVIEQNDQLILIDRFN